MDGNSWEDSDSCREEADIVLNDSDLSPSVAEALDSEIEVNLIDVFERRAAIIEEEERIEVQESRGRLAAFLPDNLRIVSPDFVSPQRMLIAGWRIYLRNEHGVVYACHPAENLRTPRNFGGPAREEFNNPEHARKLALTEDLEVLKEKFTELLAAYNYQQRLKAARKGKEIDTDSDSEGTKKGPAPPSNPDLDPIFQDIFNLRGARGIVISDTPAIRSGIGTNPSSSLNNPSPEARTVGNNPKVLPISSTTRVREELEHVIVNPAGSSPEGFNPLWSPSGEVHPEDHHPEGNPEATNPGEGNPEVTNPVDQLRGQNQAEGNPILFNIIPIPLEDPNWDTTPGTPAVTPSASPRSGPSSPRGSPPQRSLPGIFFNTFGTTVPINTPQPSVVPHTVTPVQAVQKTVTTPPSGRTTAGTTTPPVITVPRLVGVRVPTGLPHYW
ncbi:hypothetical protein R1sor_007605 [Riccia sorocarpa]|uniref:Uncharacterized protein n=1 Tax=Riccia sorocarpa TaxID=122646 RepID=A0ABD3HTG8_9MARC